MFVSGFNWYKLLQSAASQSCYHGCRLLVMGPEDSFVPPVVSPKLNLYTNGFDSDVKLNSSKCCKVDHVVPPGLL